MDEWLIDPWTFHIRNMKTGESHDLSTVESLRTFNRLMGERMQQMVTDICSVLDADEAEYLRRQRERG